MISIWTWSPIRCQKMVIKVVHSFIENFCFINSVNHHKRWFDCICLFEFWFILYLLPPVFLSRPLVLCGSLNIIVDAVIGSKLPITIADWGLWWGLAGLKVFLNGMVKLDGDSFFGSVSFVITELCNWFVTLFGGMWWLPGADTALPVCGIELLWER